MSVVFSCQGTIPKRYMLHVPCSNHNYECSFLESEGQLSKVGGGPLGHLILMSVVFHTCMFLIVFQSLAHFLSTCLHVSNTQLCHTSQKSMITSSSIPARQSLSLKAIEQSSHHYGFKLKFCHVAVVF